MIVFLSDQPCPASCVVFWQLLFHFWITFHLYWTSWQSFIRFSMTIMRKNTTVNEIAIWPMFIILGQAIKYLLHVLCTGHFFFVLVYEELLMSHPQHTFYGKIEKVIPELSSGICSLQVLWNWLKEAVAMSTQIIWDTSSENVSWNICKMCRFRSSCIWAKYHPGLSRYSYSLQYPVILLVDSEGSNQTALDV